MRIGIDGSALTKTQPTGVERVTRDFLRAVLAQDSINRYFVYTPSPLPSEWTRFSQLTNQVVPRRWPWWTQTALPLALQRDRLDIFWSPSNLLPLWGLPPKAIATVHDLAFMRYPRAYSWAQWLGSYLTVKIAGWRARQILAISQTTANDLNKLFGLPLSRITAVYPALPTVSAPIPTAVHSSPYVLVVGRVEPRKNSERILQAFAEIRHDFPELQLVFAGPAGYRFAAIEDLTHQLGLTERVKFLSFVPANQIASWYSQAQLLLFPSLYEGFGLPILEAFAYNVPVLTANRGATAEVAGNAALLVNPESVEDIADGMRRLLRHEELRRQLVALGQERLRYFSWDRSAKQIIDLFNSL